MFDFFESVAYAEGENGAPAAEATTTDGAATTNGDAATGAGNTTEKAEDQTAGTKVPDPNNKDDQNQDVGAGGFLGMLFPILIFVLFFYFVLIRPQKKQEKKQKAMLAALQKDDKVVTIGGICGKITKIKDEYVYIETGSVGNPNERSIIKFERSAIKTVETIHE